MTPYYDDSGIVIYHGDCREVDLRPWSGTAITITDPPYGETSLGWDSWPTGWIDHAEGDELWCFGSMRMFLDHAPEFIAGGYRFAQDVVWEKHNGSGFHADRFKRVHEHVVQWYRGEWGTIYRNVPTTPDASRRTVRRKQRPPHMGNIGSGDFQSIDGGPRLMRSVIKVPNSHGSSDMTKAQHPTQKPLGIVRPIIEYSVPPGGWVFDPFAGSGSVLVAAKEAGHRAIGIEINEAYCEIAARRLSQGMLDLAPRSVPPEGIG